MLKIEAARAKDDYQMSSKEEQTHRRKESQSEPCDITENEIPQLRANSSTIKASANENPLANDLLVAIGETPTGIIEEIENHSLLKNNPYSKQIVQLVGENTRDLGIKMI